MSLRYTFLHENIIINDQHNSYARQLTHYKYLLWFLESRRKHIPLGQRMVFISRKPAFHVYKRFDLHRVLFLTFFDYYLVIVCDGTLEI